jgi:hypothetical protein
VCDLAFVLYPVMGPRFVFRDLQWSRMGSGGLARFARAYQEQGMLRGGAFPSAHVAGTVAVMAPLWRWRRTLFWALSPIAAGLMAGAVLFGYHYASDVVVGAGVGAAVTALVARHGAGSRRGAGVLRTPSDSDASATVAGGWGQGGPPGPSTPPAAGPRAS